MTDTSYWSKQRVDITAGASGIGLALARTLRDQGATVWICDVSDTVLAEAEAQVSGIGTFVYDVSDQAQCNAFVAAATKAMGGWDILANNPGIDVHAAPVEDINPEAWRRCFGEKMHG